MIDSIKKLQIQTIDTKLKLEKEYFAYSFLYIFIYSIYSIYMFIIYTYMCIYVNIMKPFNFVFNVLVP